ncbi:MAG: RNA methyltransferase [Candidatus Binatia bacterium]
MADLYVALLHHPVYDKNRNVVTASVTNIDVHDIARSCRTFGVKAFYVVTPVDALRGLVRKITRHWQEGYGSTYNVNRKEALDLVRLERTLEGVEIDIEARCGCLPELVATSARCAPESEGYEEMARHLRKPSGPHLLVLGTGWGLTDDLIARSAHRLRPITGPADYNHLSVRAAAAIILDRLLGTR